MLATLDAGDEVLLLSPAWPSYDGMLKLLGAVPVHQSMRSCAIIEVLILIYRGCL